MAITTLTPCVRVGLEEEDIERVIDIPAYNLTVYSCFYDPKIRVFSNVAVGPPVRLFQKHAYPYINMVHLYGDVVCSVDGSGYVYTWCASSGETFSCHKLRKPQPYYTVKLNESEVAFKCSDKEVVILNHVKGRIVQRNKVKRSPRTIIFPGIGDISSIDGYGKFIAAIGNGKGEIWNWGTSTKATSFVIDSNADLLKINDKFIVWGSRKDGKICTLKIMPEGRTSPCAEVDLKKYFLEHARNRTDPFINDVAFLSTDLMMVTCWLGIVFVSLPSGNIIEAFEFADNLGTYTASVLNNGFIYAAGRKGNCAAFQPPEVAREDVLQHAANLYANNNSETMRLSKDGAKSTSPDNNNNLPINLDPAAPTSLNQASGNKEAVVECVSINRDPASPTQKQASPNRVAHQSRSRPSNIAPPTSQNQAASPQKQATTTTTSPSMDAIDIYIPDDDVEFVPAKPEIARKDTTTTAKQATKVVEAGASPTTPKQRATNNTTCSKYDDTAKNGSNTTTGRKRARDENDDVVECVATKDARREPNNNTNSVIIREFTTNSEKNTTIQQHEDSSAQLAGMKVALKLVNEEAKRSKVEVIQEIRNINLGMDTALKKAQQEMARQRQEHEGTKMVLINEVNNLKVVVEEERRRRNMEHVSSANDRAEVQRMKVQVEEERKKIFRLEQEIIRIRNNVTNINNTKLNNNNNNTAEVQKQVKVLVEQEMKDLRDEIKFMKFSIMNGKI